MKTPRILLAAALLAVAPVSTAWAARPCPAWVVVELAADGSASVGGGDGTRRDLEPPPTPATDEALLAAVAERVQLARRSSCYKGRIVILHDPAVRLVDVTRRLNLLQDGGYFDVAVIDRAAISLPPQPN